MPKLKQANKEFRLYFCMWFSQSPVRIPNILLFEIKPLQVLNDDPRYFRFQDQFGTIQDLTVSNPQTINWSSNCKCFTCVTKTIANLTTYRRKPGDYNGTIIFEIDIMKNSSPLNSIFTFFAMSKPKYQLLFCWTHSTLSSVQSKSKQNKQPNNK